MQKEVRLLKISKQVRVATIVTVFKLLTMSKTHFTHGALLCPLNTFGQKLTKKQKYFFSNKRRMYEPETKQWEKINKPASFEATLLQNSVRVTK